MLLSHKVCRWMLPWAALAALLALVALAPVYLWARAAIGLALVVMALGTVGWLQSDRAGVPELFAAPAFLIAGNLAAAHALLRVLAGGEDALWKPTRREVVKAG